MASQARAPLCAPASGRTLSRPAASTAALLPRRPTPSRRHPARHLCRAGDEQPAAPEQQQPPAAPRPPSPPKGEDPESVKGARRTAIVTGAISLIFGFAYLALVQVMEMRGNELLPPPPEAYIP